MNGRTITPAGTLVLSITAIFLVVLLAYLEVQTLPLGDTVPPGRVEGLTVTPVEGGRLLLQWEAAWDDVGISHYLVRPPGRRHPRPGALGAPLLGRELGARPLLRVRRRGR